MNHPLLRLLSWNIEHKKVLLRADINVPVEDTTIIDDLRLQRLKPTLDFLLEKKAQIILIGHRGRPEGYQPELNNSVIAQWLRDHNYHVDFIPYQPTLLELLEAIKKSPAPICLLDNIRFYSQEKNHNTEFARMLASCADYFCNDAWASMHRSDTSIVLLPHSFSPEKRSIGFLVAEEIDYLIDAKEPRSPSVLLLGGKKITDKIAALEKLVMIYDTILLLPPLSSTFAAAQGIPTGISLVETSVLQTALDILLYARSHDKKMIMPIDYLISYGQTGPLAFITQEHVPLNGYIIAPGMNTIHLYEQHLAQAQSILFGGASGFLERPETMIPTQLLMQMCTAPTIIVGGDTAAAARRSGIEQSLSFISTGGSASLIYIAGQPLAGLTALYP